MTAPPLTREQAQILVHQLRLFEELRELERIPGSSAEIEACRALIAIAEAEDA